MKPKQNLAEIKIQQDLQQNLQMDSEEIIQQDPDRARTSNRAWMGSLLLTLTAMIWGTAFVFQRTGMESIEPVTFNAARSLLAGIAVLPAALLSVRRRKAATGQKMSERAVSVQEASVQETLTELNVVVPQGELSAAAQSRPAGEAAWLRATLVGGIGCGLFLAVASFFQQTGLVYTTAGKAGFITSMYMLLVPILNALLFHKKNSLQVWMAVALGVLGMYLLCMTESFSVSKGDALVCICALTFSGHILCCDRFVSRADPVLMSAIQFMVAAVLSTAVALLTEAPTWDKLVSAAIPILYCGLISGGIGYTLQIVAQRYTDPAVASLLMSLESVFAVLAGTLLLHERMRPQELLGCVVMFLAIVMVQIPLPRFRAAKRRTE